MADAKQDVAAAEDRAVRGDTAIHAEAHESLLRDQSAFMAALQKGPDYLPNEMFSGTLRRAFLGVKAHANTISHARLVAIEDSYPKLRERLGPELFNTLSRDFIEQDTTRQKDINDLGQGFADYIAEHGVDGASVDLARIEWAWLQSYHAADADVLTMQDIAALDEDGLMALPLIWAPSTQYIILQDQLAPELGLDTDDAVDLVAIAIARQNNDVLIYPQNIEQKAIFETCQKSVLMRNLLEVAIETIGETRAVEHIFALIGAGFLLRPDNV